MIQILLWSSVSLAGESALWSRQLVGAGAFPLGALSDTRVQVRAPGHRSDSVLFQDTYQGAGLRVQLSPAFVDLGPRLSIAPIDVFDLDLQASWTGYAGPFAPIGFSELTGKLESDRDARPDEPFPLSKVELAASPTLKAKVGPIVAFDSATFSLVQAQRPEDQLDPYWYEPYRDLVLAWEDVTVENQGAVAWMVLPGEDRPKLWLGGTARYRAALVSTDHTAAAGLLVVCKPGTSATMPTFVGQALAWLADEERVGTAPNLNLAATWTFDGLE